MAHEELFTDLLRAEREEDVTYALTVVESLTRVAFNRWD
jgi:hypothetical protein